MGRLRVDPIERASELFLHTKRHRERQKFIEQLRMTDDDALQMLGLHAAEKLLESQYVLERARPHFRARRHDLREQNHDEE